MTPVTMLVQVIEHSDVRGNKLLYLKINYKGKDVLINIGQKTHDAVKELAEGTTQQPIPGIEKVPQGIIDAAKEAAKQPTR